MLYSPHILKKKFVNKVVNKYNEVISSSEEWKEMGRCRCDDNSTEHFTTDNGSIYTPKYHIVCDKCQISEGDEVKVYSDDGSYRGGGKVYNASKCNYLGYMSIYV